MAACHRRSRHDEGLNEAMFANRIRQIEEGIGVYLVARLSGVRYDFLDVYFQQARGSFTPRDESAKSFAKTSSYLRHVASPPNHGSVRCQKKLHPQRYTDFFRAFIAAVSSDRSSSAVRA